MTTDKQFGDHGAGDPPDWDPQLAKSLVRASGNEDAERAQRLLADAADIAYRAFELGVRELEDGLHAGAERWLRTAIDYGLEEARPLWEVCANVLDPNPYRVTDGQDEHEDTVTAQWGLATQQDKEDQEDQGKARIGYRDLVTALSRRNQSLVQRQLQLIERLKGDEEDADQPATLFQLDHLATRMRRNNENLMVLSCAEPRRRSGQPVTTGDVLRAAVSEIEQYQRVVVQTPPSARIVGYAASDLIRLIAELLDNATTFSAPETQVTVSTRVFEGGGLLVEITDKGIGMNEAEIAEANARLTEAATVDPATSRRMGLFVVGRLASRHNITVALHGGKDIVGVRATLTVPADLVTDLTETVPIRALAPGQQPGSALPRRRTVNDAGQPGALTNLAGNSGTLGDRADTSGGWGQNNHSGVLRPPPRDLKVSPLPRVEQDQPEPPPEPPAPQWPESKPETSVSALFAASNTGALTEGWGAAEPTPVSSPPQESTPIFDETVSAWFRTALPESQQSTEVEQPETAEKATSRWDFAADASWRTVQAVSRTEPTSYTEAGLPRRRRGEQLMPGGITPTTTTDVPAPGTESGRELPVRDPADVRGRLSNFQRGVNRARHAAREQPRQETADAATKRRARQAAELPRHQQPHTPEEPSSEPATSSGESAWSFATNESQQTVRAVSHIAPLNFPDAGLPRRRPDTASNASPAGSPTQRDQQDVRGGLNSFQQGVRRGRHRAAQPADSEHETAEGT